MGNNSTDDNFRNFLFQVAHWKALDWFKRNNRQQVACVSVEVVDSIIADPSLNSLDKMVGNEYVASILEVIRETTPLDSMRDVFLLRYMEERSYREIAVIIADQPLSPEDLVREANRLRQGCKRLRARVRTRIQERLS